MGKNDASIISPPDGEMMEAPEEPMEKTSQESATFQISSLANEEILNASFTSETGKISDVSMWRFACNFLYFHLKCRKCATEKLNIWVCFTQTMKYLERKSGFA